jgi:hypothetical protein
MTREAIKEAIVRAVSDSKFQVDFINNNDNGSLIIKVSRPTTNNYCKTIKGVINGEEDIGKFEEVLTEQMN